MNLIVEPEDANPARSHAFRVMESGDYVAVLSRHGSGWIWSMRGSPNGGKLVCTRKEALERIAERLEGGCPRTFDAYMAKRREPVERRLTALAARLLGLGPAAADGYLAAMEEMAIDVAFDADDVRARMRELEKEQCE